ncbi:MAG: hypothetical protein WKG52_06985 [Variovorax sp.]
MVMNIRRLLRSARLRRLLGWSAAIAATLAVFGMYTRPDFLVLVADQVWACF